MSESILTQASNIYEQQAHNRQMTWLLIVMVCSMPEVLSLLRTSNILKPDIFNELLHLRISFEELLLLYLLKILLYFFGTI
jgi:hypothetical protein